MRTRRLGTWLACMGLLLLLMVGCFETQAAVTYVNDTGLTLSVTSGESRFVLNSESSKSFQTIKQGWPQTVEAADENGRVIFSRSYTWDELKGAGFKIEITVQLPAGTPAPLNSKRVPAMTLALGDP